MRVLVTGGAGYVGSVVVDLLAAAGHEAVVYDNLARGHRDAVAGATRFVHGEILDTDGLGRTLRGGIEAVVHLAAETLVAESVGHPARYYRVNVQGTLSLLEAMRKAGVPHLISASTAAVYGDARPYPVDEHDPLCPTSPHGETQLVIERALPWYEAAYGIRSIRLRCFNPAGASANKGERHAPETHLLPRLLAVAAGRLSDVTLFGDDYPTRDGTCVRDYVHIVDVARAYLVALDALAAGAPSASYNVGAGGEGHSVRETIAAVERVTGRPIQVRVGHRRPGDPAFLVANRQRIARELGWVPAEPELETIVESAWRWMRNRGLDSHALDHAQA
jgi:UDP-glucose-4-epimerase GalE